MIVLLSHKDDFTTDLVVRELHKRRASFRRLNTEDLPTLCAQFSSKEDLYAFRSDLFSLKLETITSVWYRRPGVPNISERVPADLRTFALEEYNELSRCLQGIAPPQCFWMNHPHNNAIAENKLVQLAFMRRFKTLFPHTVVTNDPDMAWRFYQEEQQLVCKSMRQGIFTQASETRGIYTWLLPPGLSREDFAGVAYCPTQLQQWIPKRADIRTTVVGDHIISVRIDSQMLRDTSVDWRTERLQELPHSEIGTPEQVASFIGCLMSSFHLHFAALDFVESIDGSWYFLEVNPNGQWAWLEQLAGVRIAEAIADTLIGGEQGHGS